jgi:hypothetical protein
MLADDKKNEYLFFFGSETDSTNPLPPNVKTIVAKTKVSPIQAASASDGGRRKICGQ